MQQGDLWEIPSPDAVGPGMEHTLTVIQGSRQSSRQWGRASFAGQGAIAGGMPTKDDFRLEEGRREPGAPEDVDADAASPDGGGFPVGSQKRGGGFDQGADRLIHRDIGFRGFPPVLLLDAGDDPVSYTHLTLPTNREV